MIPTRRLVALAALLAALSAATLFLDGARLPVLALDGLLVAAVLVDALRTPSPARIGLRRELPLSAGLSTVFQRRMHVDPGPAAGLRLEIREEFPESCTVVRRSSTAGDAPAPGDPTGGPDVLWLPRGPVVVPRTYSGALRGVHAFGRVRLRVAGALGLVQKQALLAGHQEVAIEPALADLRRTLALAASERWFDLGVRHLRRRGGRTEFESLRDYVQGDDVRLVDWKAFAKRGKPTVRQHQEERGQELILLIDTGRRMRATGAEGEQRGWTKLDWALDAALQLAAVALQKGDRVGCGLYDDRLRSYVAPARGSRQLARLREAVFDRLPSERESDPGRALLELAARHRRRAMVVLLSDVADPDSVEAQRRALARASRRHRLIFACLDDPAVRLAAEGHATRTAAPDAALAAPPGALRAAALQQVAERRRALRRLSGVGVRVLDTLPAEAAGPLLAAWLDVRRSGAA